MEANFQPADTLVEPMGKGSVATDKRTGWRMVSKDGRSQRLYRPDGTLHGIYSSADEAKLVLNKLSLKALEFEASSAKTQIATTVNTYAKASSQLDPKGKTIDYGAGLGLGADVLREKGFATDSYEPFPDRWKGKQGVTFTDSFEIPSNAYENVTNFSVLNVVKPDVRNFIVSEIGRILAPKGKALITARTLQDVSAAKIKTPSTEPGGFIVGDRYQKGFSQKELKVKTSPLPV
jgi:SAM-dependent methyltransferase